MKMSQPTDQSLMSLHIRRPRGRDTVPCVLTLQKATGLVVSEICEDAAGKPVSIHSEALPSPRRLKLFLTESPCWFAGCEELRASYLRDIEVLPEDCPLCEFGKIQRRYLDKMAELGV